MDMNWPRRKEKLSTLSEVFPDRGPSVETGTTPLQRAFGDENVLRVSLEKVPKEASAARERYQSIFRVGILCGLKKFSFFGMCHLLS